MKPLHALGALLIVVMWGFNFTAIRFGLDEYQPFTFATWRFALAALPVLFVPRPAISWTTFSSGTWRGAFSMSDAPRAMRVLMGAMNR